jgi:hypothetical protein
MRFWLSAVGAMVVCELVRVENVQTLERSNVRTLNLRIVLTNPLAAIAGDRANRPSLSSRQNAAGRVKEKGRFIAKSA